MTPRTALDMTLNPRNNSVSLCICIDSLVPIKTAAWLRLVVRHVSMNLIYTPCKIKFLSTSSLSLSRAIPLCLSIAFFTGRGCCECGGTFWVTEGASMSVSMPCRQQQAPETLALCSLTDGRVWHNGVASDDKEIVRCTPVVLTYTGWDL